MVIFLKIVGFLADGVGPDIRRNKLRYDFLGPNMEINLDGYFSENCLFPGGWCRLRY